MKKKSDKPNSIEVSFKCEIPLEKPKDSDLKQFLEKNIHGIVISNISRKTDKFTIQSNIYNLLTANRTASKENTAEILRLRSENLSLQDRAHEFEDKFSAAQQIKDHIAKELEQLKLKISQINEENNAKEIQINTQQQNLQKKDKEIMSLLEKNRELAVSAGQLEADKNALIEDVQKLCEKLVEHEKTFKSIMEHTKSLEGENATLYAEAKEYEKHVHELNTNLSAMKAKKANDVAVRKNSGEFEVLKRHTQELEEMLRISNEDQLLTRNKLREVQAIIKDQEDKLKIMKREIQEKDESFRELEENNTGLERDYQLAENQIEILQMKLEENEKQIATFRRQIQNLEKVQKNNDTLNATLKQKAETLDLELKKKDREYKVREDQIKITTQNCEEKVRLVKQQCEKLEKILASKNDELKGQTSEKIDRSKDSLVELTKLREDIVQKNNELISLKDELSEYRIKLTDTNSKLDAKAEMLQKAYSAVADQEKDLTNTKNKLKEFETLADNLEILERTKRQLEDLQADYAKLKNSSEDSISLLAQLDEVKKQKETLTKEFTSLKAYLFENEQKLLMYEKSGGKIPVSGTPQKYKILEEIKAAFCEIMSLCKAMDTMAKEMMVIYEEKRDKAQEYAKFLPEYENTKNKEERLNMSQVLGNSFQFLNFIPKKLINMQIIDDVVLHTLKQRQKKINVYEDAISKYEKLIDVAVSKFNEYDQRLSCY